VKDLLDMAASYRLYAIKKSNAYYAAAEYYSRKHTRLGVAATAISALVGTTVFTSLTQQGASVSSWLPSSALTWVSLFVVVLSAAAPVLIALHTFLRFAERAERHRVAAAGYDRVRQRLDVFAIRYGNATDAVRTEALKQFEEIVAEFGALAEISLSIPDSIYDRAYPKTVQHSPQVPRARPSTSDADD
jgi:hypothetical protein